MKEEFFIKQFDSRYIGDDGAALKMENVKCKIENEIIASDSFFEDVHFKKEWMSLEDISYKASLVNISDMIVMNAKPVFAILNVGFPKSFSLKDIKNLAEGFKKAAREYHYEIIGGDTIRNNKIAISVTHIGFTKKAVFRKAKLNEYVAFTGTLGSSAKDLKEALRFGKINKNSKLIKPVLRDKFFYKASKYITAACDISDSLFKELERISKMSKIGYKFLKNYDKNIGCSGEEYEILFTFPKKNIAAIKHIARITRTKITIFAVTKRGKYRSLCRENHF